MTRPDSTAIPLVRKHLPDEPLDAFLDRNWVPVLNAFNRAHETPQDPDAFPLRWALMAPNTKEFLAVLGKSPWPLPRISRPSRVSGGCPRPMARTIM